MSFHYIENLIIGNLKLPNGVKTDTIEEYTLGAGVTINSNLTVNGTLTKINTVDTLLKDDYIYLRSGYNQYDGVGGSGGVVINVFAEDINTNIDSFVNNVLTISGDLNYVAGNFVENNGSLYEVESIVLNTLTLRLNPTQPFSQKTMDLQLGRINVVRVSVIRSTVLGVWEKAIGNNADTLVFSLFTYDDTDVIKSSIPINTGTTNRVATFNGITGRLATQSAFDTTSDNFTFVNPSAKMRMWDNYLSAFGDMISTNNKSLSLGFANNITGLNTLHVGYGNQIQGGDSSIMIGFDNLSSADNVSTSNIGIGTDIAPLLTTTGTSIFLGNSIAPNMTAGNHNIFLGHSVASSFTSGINNIYLGDDQAGIISENNKLRIGNTTTDGVYIKGINGVNTGQTFYKLPGVIADNKIEDTTIYVQTPNTYGLSFSVDGQPAIGVGITNLINYGHGNLLAATSAANNVLMGNGILTAATTGCNNNFIIGTNVLNGSLSGIQNNVCMGNGISTFFGATNIQGNVFLGNNISGNFNGCAQNIVIGISSGNNITNNNRCIYFDNDGVAAETDTIRIGEVGTHTDIYLAGIGNDTVSNKAVLVTDTLTGKVVNTELPYLAESSFEDFAIPYTRSLAINVPAEIAFTQTLMSDDTANWDASVAGRLQYLGLTTSYFSGSFSFSLFLNSGANINVELALYKNGVKVVNSAFRRQLASTTEYDIVSFNKMVQLATNDFVSVYITNLSGNESVDFGNCNLVLRKAI